jgi:fatty acid-binding protein DegV
LNQAYHKIASAIESAVGSSQKVKVAYMHAGASEKIAKLKEIIEARFNCAESFIAELSPALMVHTGPGTTGLCYFPAE